MIRGSRRQLRRLLMSSATVVAGALVLGAAPALANAPNPIPGTTVLDSVAHNGDGTVTVTVHGQWDWATQTNCPQNRNGVGYQVAWFDGNTANQIGSSSSPDGVLSVGDSIDNIVHSVETLGGSSANDNAFWDGVPASYLTHNTTDSTPTKTDAANWFSNCDNVNPTTKVSSGTWGPVSHTYPAGTTSITLCPIMYDPHGGKDDSGKSSVQDITAGGKGHNTDNSYEGNGQTVSGNQCLKSNFSTPPPTPPTTTPSTPPSSPTTAPTKTVSPTVTHKKHHRKRHVKAKRISRKPKHNSGFTG